MTQTRILTIALLAFLFAGCGTLPDMPAENDGNSTRSGDTAGKSTGVRPSTANAVTTGTGDPVANSVQSDASRQTTNTNGAPNIGVVNLAGLAMSAQKALEQAGTTDPLVVSITAELAALQSSETPDVARVDALRAQLADRLATIQGSVERMGGSFPALTTIVAQIQTTLTAGQDHQSLTDAEAAAAASGFPAAVNAAGDLVEKSK